jgi:hypothetical protein
MTSIKTAATSKDNVLTDSELDTIAGGLLPTGEDSTSGDTRQILVS